MDKETPPLISILYIAYFGFLLYNILNRVENKQTFLKDDCYPHQIISAAAKESLLLYKLTQRAPETQNR